MGQAFMRLPLAGLAREWDLTTGSRAGKDDPITSVRVDCDRAKTNSLLAGHIKVHGI